MSGSNGRNSRELFQDGITVQQTFSEETFGVPAVRIQIDSERALPTEITLAITLPESESVDRVGFHPDYDPDNWSIDENTLSYHARLSPEADVTTVYAVQDLASDNGSVLLENLTIQDISTVDEGETEGGHDSQTGSDESVEGTESEDDGASDGEAETQGQSDRPDPTDSEDVEHGRPEPGQSAVTASVAETETAGDASGESEAISIDDDETEEVSVGTSSQSRRYESSDSEDSDADDGEGLGAYSDTRLVDELLLRLESGDLSSDYRQQLRDRFGPDESASGGSLDQRVSDLQRRVSDAEAFSTSVEAVHEQHGSPAEVFDETKAELDDVAKRIDGLDERIDELDAQGDDVESRISGIETDVDELQADLADIEDRMDAAAAERSELEATVTDLIEWREQFVGSLTDLGGE